MASSSHQSSLSRLDRVLTLLENGASPVTRKAAAKQLGDVQKKYPRELNNLLAKLLVYVCHNEWDTRLGAAEAIEAVVAQVPVYSPDAVTLDNVAVVDEKDTDKLSFDMFNIDKVLNGSKTLLGSSGDEYKISINLEGLSAKDRVTKQRKILEKQLGLTVGDTSLGVASSELFQDADLVVHSAEKTIKVKQEPKQSCSNIISQFGDKMSSRERNLAKRKAKLLMKQQSREVVKQENNGSNGQPAKKRKKNQDSKSNSNQIIVDDVPKHCSEPQEWTEWPFNWISDELINLLFNPAWESRHGACLALREIIKKHGKGCGKLVGMTTNQLNKSNQAWLTDLSIRLLCVISLDRFADFVSDQAVAPVRESCAQTLSVVASFMEEKRVYEVIRILLYLHTKDEWEVRQSAMLVLQYIIAVRKDLQANILPLSFPTIVQGLHDSDGDVKSVSAKALVPVVQLLTRDSKYDEQLKLLLSILWDSLQEYDELTSSTQSILLLLSRLIKSMPLAKICQSSRPDRLLSFLWPFFHHALASVREAALSTAISMLSGEDKVFAWLSSVSVQGLLNTFQCCLLEPKSYIRSLSEKVFNLLMSKSPASSLFPGVYHAPQWLSLACQPPLVPYDPGLLLGQNVETTIENESCHKERVIGGRITNTSCIEEFEEYIMRTRELTGRMIGMLCRNVFSSHVTDSNSDLQSLLHLLKQHLVGHMKSSSAIQRIVALIVLANWCEESNMLPSSVSPEIFDSVITLQNETLFYIEISIKFVQVQTDMKNLLAALSRKNIQSSFPVKSVYLFEDILEFCTDVFPHLVTSNHADLIEQKDLLLKLAEDANRTQCLLDSRVKSYAATVVITAARSSLCREESPWKLPTKLNPVIRPLMDCVKKEENPTVRTTVALSLSHLIRLCSTREPNPSNKLIKNLCTFLTSSSVACPSMESIAQEITDETLKSLSLSRELLSTRGLLTQLRQCEANLNETSKRKKKIADSSEIQQTSTTVSCMGACKCLQTICVTFGEDALRFVPQLFHIIDLLQGLSMHNNINDSGEFLQNIAQAVAALSAILPAVDNSVLQDKVLALLPSVMILLWNELTNLRFIASRCIALYAQHLTYKAMPAILDRILMSFDQASNDVAKKGAVEAVAIIINDMGTSIVSYAVLLFVPLLGCMSDQDPQIRLLSTHCFAQLLQYIAIESSIPDPPELPPHLLERKNKERQFLDQLFDPSSLEAYKIAVPINAKLRSYQEDGVKWLAFLNRYKLHGVLCDEMGLGKTLQTICIIASDHYYKAQRCKGDTGAKIKSLVICPPTLTGHWVDEVEKFCNDLKPLQYAGNPSKRAKLQPQVNNCNLVIASYEVVRNDIDFFNKFKWNYCVLDEGHAIRNGKSKTSQTVKTLSSNHRLILTGTPIQNSVLELWSLFDFLMPGFLGSEHEFNVSYTKPIVASRDAKSSSKEQENGVLALEALHRQVLPFMFRRMKEDVLKDLPPKIIQDYYCDLSALQLELYEDFARSRAKKDAELSINNVDNEKDQKLRSKEASHIFQALQYLQKVCNHPALVLTSSHPHYKQAMAKLQSTNSSLHDVKHATKLTALKQLLLDCGIGVTSDVVSEQSVVNQHRALIFCQHRNMLDIIQKDLLEALMPTVTFLRLDGMVPANQRFSLVTRFNSDPSIDLLLLTTKVGGLGLNLTGADTVIFFEHDWNPMVDLQAMDRAHRIGQKKVVNVYRLITRGTLEEKVLGLQKFKLNIANAVVGEDNRRLQSMGTSQVLELFTVNTASARKKAKEDANSSRGLRAMMEDLGDLWDHNQYNDAYNLDNFLQNLTTDK